MMPRRSREAALPYWRFALHRRHRRTGCAQCGVASSRKHPAQLQIAMISTRCSRIPNAHGRGCFSIRALPRPVVRELQQRSARAEGRAQVMALPESSSRWRDAGREDGKAPIGRKLIEEPLARSAKAMRHAEPAECTTRHPSDRALLRGSESSSWCARSSVVDRAFAAADMTR